MKEDKQKGSVHVFRKVRQVTRMTSSVLSEIANQVGWITAFRPIGMGWAEHEDRKARRRAYEEREYLRMLERCKFVETKRIGKKLMVRLTGKGWQQVLRDKIRTVNKKRKEGICLVIFDVPESERRVRDVLREFLVDLEFKMIQKSVWATNKDVLRELCALLQGAGLYKWVRIIIGQELKQSYLQQTLVRLPAMTKRLRHKKR